VQTHRLSPAALRLLDLRLNSFEKLEITIALHRTAAHTLSVPELSTKLQLSSQMIVEYEIDELARAGVVHSADGVARLTLDPKDIPAMDEIAAIYDEDRLLVVRTLTEISMNKIRGLATQAFGLPRNTEEDDDV
jgi:hypothetical protein